MTTIFISSQLASFGASKRNDQLSKLGRVLHVVEESLDLGKVHAMDTAADHGPHLGVAHKLYHFGKLFARAHGRAADLNVAQHGAHEEVHLGGDGHAVHGYDTAVL